MPAMTRCRPYGSENSFTDYDRNRDGYNEEYAQRYNGEEYDRHRPNIRARY